MCYTFMAPAIHPLSVHLVFHSHQKVLGLATSVARLVHWWGWRTFHQYPTWPTNTNTTAMIYRFMCISTFLSAQSNPFLCHSMQPCQKAVLHAIVGEGNWETWKEKHVLLPLSKAQDHQWVPCWCKSKVVCRLAQEGIASSASHSQQVPPSPASNMPLALLTPPWSSHPHPVTPTLQPYQGLWGPLHCLGWWPRLQGSMLFQISFCDPLSFLWH